MLDKLARFIMVPHLVRWDISIDSHTTTEELKDVVAELLQQAETTIEDVAWEVELEFHAFFDELDLELLFQLIGNITNPTYDCWD